MFKNLISYILSFILFTSIFGLQCGELQISNCLKCEKGIDYDYCGLCENKYFPLPYNIACRKCDDIDFGQIGCGGNCDVPNYEMTRIPLCKENDCKDGYFNLNGICFRCDKDSPHCEKCSYLAPAGSNQKQFKCLKCDSTDYQLLKSTKCEKCEVTNCKPGKCYFDDYDESSCSECENDYYVKNKKCEKCFWQNIDGGKYYFCGFPKPPSQCNSGYVSDNNISCLKCPSGCINCYYNSITNKANCESCSSGYYLKNNICFSCPEKCGACSFINNEVICSSCYRGSFLIGKTCISCTNHCASCNTNKVCVKCETGYQLYNDECLSCEKYLKCRYRDIKIERTY